MLKNNLAEREICVSPEENRILAERGKSPIYQLAKKLADRPYI